MLKDQAEKQVRHLSTVWAREGDRGEHPSFSEFYAWVKDRHPSCTEFRSTMGAREAMELWFDDELKQNWRR